MLRRIGIGLVYATVGYAIGAFGGGYLVSIASSNEHDRSIEAAITGAFVTGPILAIFFLIAGLLLSARRSL